MVTLDASIEPLGDSAVLVRVGADVDRDARDWMLALARSLERDPLPGQRDVVAAPSSLALLYDPTAVVEGADPFELIERRLRERIPTIDAEAAGEPRLVEIPVCYDRVYAHDIEAVAEHRQLSVDDVIAIHSSRTYRVSMIGFTPGFPYLDELDERLAIPRRATPREHVAAGSVAIADRRTGIYPTDSPGGWWIIGWTPVKLFTPTSDPPSLLVTGDRVRFRPVTREALLGLAS